MRSINKAIEIVFDIVKMQFDSPANFADFRYIAGDKGRESECIEWLSRSKIVNKFALSQQSMFALIEFNSDLFFITIGFEDPDTLPSGLVEEIVNAGLFTAIVSEFELPIKNGITNMYLEQNILAESTKTPLYTGHLAQDLKKIFPNIYAMKITSSYGGDARNIHQLIAYLVTENGKFSFLSFSKETLGKIQELIACNSSILSYESITQALFSSHFKFAFLDLYRCVELLYQLIYLDETYQKLKLKTDRTDFLILIENDLSWKPKERTSLIKIFNETPFLHIQAINAAIREAAPGIKDYGNWLYDLRCNIVHLKSIQKKFELTDKNWEKIIFGTSNLLCYWYAKYPNFN